MASKYNFDDLREPETELAAWLEEALSRGPLAELLAPDVPSRRRWEQALLGPARSFLSRPSKGLRARLVERTWSIASTGSAPCPPELPIIIELLHAGSLVIDDIEDGSSERRGESSLHEAHGVPVALNTGNWMYFAALVVLDHVDAPAERVREAQRRTHRALMRCHHGQALDVSLHVAELPQREITEVVSATTRLKTGSLMELAAAIPTLIAGADEPRTTALVEFGRSMGVGLQMLDDLSGLMNAGRMHKGHEDIRQGRPTWPWAWLAQSCGAAPFERMQRGARAVADGTREPSDVAEAMRAGLGRRGYTAVHTHLQGALAGLRDAVGSGEDVEALAGEVGRLEASYG